MTPADLRALAADHAHIRHHPHEVADALVQAADWIEHYEKRVADLVNVANALSVELRDALQGGEPVAWMYEHLPPRSSSGIGGWDRHLLFCKPAEDKYKRNITPLYAAPQPVEQRKPITDGEIDTALRTTHWAPGTSLDARCHAVARWVERMHGIGIQDGIKEAP